MDAIVTNTNPPARVFFVYLRDGRTFPVAAASWARRVAPDDEIKFFDASSAELKTVFLRAPDTSAIAPDSEIAFAHPLTALQEEVKNLASRLDAMESSLDDRLARAVITALTQRGL